MKCYLPCRGEFGWMIVCFVKKFHADPHPNKLICCKPGHEYLYPTATQFFYDWQDIPDAHKAGFAVVSDEEEIKQKLISQYPDQELEFISLSEVGWHNKHDFAKHTFIPIAKQNYGLDPVVVIAPRKREMDAYRNWTQEKWQHVVNRLVDTGYSVGVCGTKETCFDLHNIKFKAYEHLDVDSDVEMMTKARLIITQESGLQYLVFLCQKPVIHIDRFEVGHEHRNPTVFFKNMPEAWDNAELLARCAIDFLRHQ